MNKIFITAFVALILSACESNTKKIGPFESEKVLCRENTDSVLAHMGGMAVVDSFYNVDQFYSTNEQQFYKYIKVTRVSNGADTLVVIADNGSDDCWEARVVDYQLTLSNNVDKIKRHNLLMKELFASDTCFILEVGNSQILNATFRKEKPKEPERPLEDYGLDENDL